MSSLYKRANDYWYVAFHDGSKRPTRKHVSTGTKAKRDAVKAQKRFDRAILLNEFDPWTDDPDTFEPKQPQRDGSPNLALLGSSVAAFLASRSNLSPYTQERYRSVLERLRDSLGAEREVAGLSTTDILRFLDGTDTKPVTQHSYRRAMRTYFRWLEERDAVASDPTADLRLERAPDKHPRFLEPSDVEAICRAIVENEQRPKVTPGTSGWLLPIVRANVYLEQPSSSWAVLASSPSLSDSARSPLARTPTSCRRCRALYQRHSSRGLSPVRHQSTERREISPSLSRHHLCLAYLPTSHLSSAPLGRRRLPDRRLPQRRERSEAARDRRAVR